MLEATRNWPFLYDLLTEHVARVELAHPKELKAISTAAIKTDQIDAKVLAHLARLNFLPTAFAAPPETRDLRLYLRHREKLVQDRTQSKNRIHAVLASYNLRIPGTDPFGKTGRAWLQENLDGNLLRPAARRVIRDHLALIDQLDAQLTALVAGLPKFAAPLWQKGGQDCGCQAVTNGRLPHAQEKRALPGDLLASTS